MAVKAEKNSVTDIRYYKPWLLAKHSIGKTDDHCYSIGSTIMTVLVFELDKFETLM